VIPSNTYTEFAAKRGNQVTTTTTEASYEDAAATCRAKVEKIVKECRRINKKYRDPHFDIEVDLKLYRNDCLQSLSNAEGNQPGLDLTPQSVKRVGDIFDKPCFYIDGPTANDVRQGRDGDCWLMAALCTLSEKAGLIEKLCVAHDQDVGVYGFVFYRDGAWISEIVDDFVRISLVLVATQTLTKSSFILSSLITTRAVSIEFSSMTLSVLMQMRPIVAYFNPTAVPFTLLSASTLKRPGYPSSRRRMLRRTETTVLLRAGLEARVSRILLEVSHLSYSPLISSTRYVTHCQYPK
jgi:hypothetical protein